MTAPTQPSTARRMGRRAAVVTAAVAALGLATATAASAHHCYKTDWNAVAYERLAQGGTAWLPLSDLGAYFIAAPVEEGGYGAPQCTDVADDAVAAWMEATETTAEPLIHSRATAARGAAYQGRAPKGFMYLEDADFDILIGVIAAGIPGCLAP